jgi:hypothetical protein
MGYLTDKIVAGFTLEFSATAPDYPASEGWALKYRLAPRASGSIINLSSVADGDNFLVQVSAATTAGWTAGAYTYEAYVEKGSESYPLERGPVQIVGALAGGQDNRLHVEKVIEAIEAVIENRASLDQEEVSVNGRSLKRTPVADLIVFRNKYRSELRSMQAAERLANGITGGGRRIQMVLR